MKAENLQILQKNNFNVPKFIVINNINELNTIDLNFASNFAVRSSFDIEDGDNKSYAGQFETLLNVKKENLFDAILKVENSYKNNNKFQKVIIQEMINSDISGVLFTSNPIGILNETVIVIGNGLGCNVVEDKIETTTYYYNKDDEIYYFEKNENSPILDEDIFKELIHIGNKINDIFSKPMDIEFCIKDNNIYILQARPITTLYLKNSIILDNSNIVESYPDVSLPLTQSFVKEIYYKIFKYCILHLSKDENLVEKLDKYLQNMTDIANNRIYYRISNWYSVLNLLPFSKKIIEIWQEMLGVENKEISYKEEKVPFITKIKILTSFFVFLINTPKKMNELNIFFSKQLFLYNQKLKESNDIYSLLKLYESIKEELVQKWDITLVNDMYTFIYTFLSGKKNQKYISNIKNLESMKPIIALNKLKNIAFTFGFNSDTYFIQRNRYIEEFGDRVLNELKLETKTYRTNPELLDSYLKQNDCIVKQTNEFKSKNIFVKKARLGIKNREVSRMNRSRIFGLTRSIFLKIGNILKKENIIENSDDIFYFTIDEIKDNKVTKELLQIRKKEIENSKKIPNYSRLVLDKEIINKNICSEQKLLNNTNKLYGIGTSLGTIEGEIFIITDINDINTIPKDKIIVTKTTDPGWVFIIENAKGIIAEKGSLLSHTAIITRELGKPSIVNVKNATSILKNGMKVKLDANKGEIEVLNDV